MSIHKTDYSAFRNGNLSAECKRRGLPYSGNKATLVARLVANDKLIEEQKAAEAAEAEAAKAAEVEAAFAKAAEGMGKHLQSRMNELMPFMVDTPYTITENTKLDTNSCEYVAQAAKAYTTEEHKDVITKLSVTNITTEELAVVYSVHEAMKISHMYDIHKVMDREKGARISAKVIVTHKRTHKEWDKKKRRNVKVFKMQTIATFELPNLDYDKIKTSPLARVGWKTMDVEHWKALTPTKSKKKDYKGIAVPTDALRSVSTYFNQTVKRIYRALSFGFIAPSDTRGNDYDCKIIVTRRA